MKRIITLLSLVALFGFSVYAGGGWATSAVSVTKDGGSAYLYVLNNEGWTDGDWGSNTAFNAYSFGTPTSLVLNGGKGNAWTDDSPGYDATSFIIYYRVYKSDTAPGSWQTINLDFLAYSSGSNKIYDKTNASIDILSLATIEGTHTYSLEVVMSKKQMYTGGEWLSMVPGGQGTAYDAANAGYIATFTKTTVYTGTENLPGKGVKIYSTNKAVRAEFTGNAHIELFSITGQLIKSVNATNNFSSAVHPGIYMLRINGATHRVLVK